MNEPHNNQDTQGRIHWHDAFFAAIQMELWEYENILTFENEHQLSKEALIMDVLIVKKAKNVHIDKNIGRIFRTHNIFEYKSETDSLSIPDYHKVLAYGLEILNIIRACRRQAVLNEKNVYLNRILEANKMVLKEALKMSTALDLLWEAAEETGRMAEIEKMLEKRVEERIEKRVEQVEKRVEEQVEKRVTKAKIEMAKKMLLSGEPVQKVADFTDLPPETIKDLP